MASLTVDFTVGVVYTLTHVDRKNAELDTLPIYSCLKSRWTPVSELHTQYRILEAAVRNAPLPLYE
jgi:hypothetical protein